MKKILTLILLSLFFSFSFSETIIKKNGEKIENCIIKGTEDYKLFYELDGDEDFINCSFIEKIYDNKNEEIEILCGRKRVLYYENKTEDGYIKTDTNLVVKEKNQFSIGGGFIAVGSILLFTTIDSECNDCSLTQLENHIDGLKTSSKLGYLFLAIGGGLIAIGL